MLSLHHPHQTFSSVAVSWLSQLVINTLISKYYIIITYFNGKQAIWQLLSSLYLAASTSHINTSSDCSSVCNNGEVRSSDICNTQCYNATTVSSINNHTTKQQTTVAFYTKYWQLMALSHVVLETMNGQKQSVSSVMFTSDTVSTSLHIFNRA